MLTQAAYGFRIAGGPEDGSFAVREATDWPVLELVRDSTVTAEEHAHLDPRRLRVRISSAVGEDEIVHPFLARVTCLLARRRGIDAMHAGALVGEDGAWAVTGPKEAGKSSLLAQCHLAGAEVLTDDVLALDGTRCLAGPRCIDLREESARLLDAGVPVRGMTRHRVQLPPVRAQADLAGVIHLAWGPKLELVALPPSVRLARLAGQRAQDTWPRDPSLVLDLAVRPAYELRRPLALDSLRASAALLIDRLGHGLTPA